MIKTSFLFIICVFGITAFSLSAGETAPSQPPSSPITPTNQSSQTDQTKDQTMGQTTGQTTNEKSYQLPKLSVQASKAINDHMSGGGGVNINEQFLNAFTSGNAQITDFLTTHPNVQFDNSFRSSKTPGEIDPPNVSINGATFYQNSFMLDGVNMNNDLDPGANTPPSHFQLVPGRSQGLGIDASLIKSIEVFDSNVSAKYGGFEGGVINAKTKDPSTEFKAKISYQFTSSKLTKYHIDESQQESFEYASTIGNQPEFFKQNIRAQAQGYVSKNIGLIASFATTQSTIPMHVYNKKDNIPEKRDTKRRIDNYFLKGVYKGVENLDLEASLTYAPQDNKYFVYHAKDSYYSIVSGGWQAALKANYHFTFAQLSNTLSYNDESNSRRSDKQYFKNWIPSPEKNWGAKQAIEGAWGNVDSIQRKLSYRSDMDFEKFELFHTHHGFSAGFLLDYTNAYYARPNESTNASRSNTPLKDGDSCAETDYCSASPVDMNIITPKKNQATWKDNKGQYFNSIDVYQKGKINLDNFAYGLYLQDSIDFWRFNFRPGVRLDGDTYMQKLTIAPRLALNMDVFGNGLTYIFGGYNRYYGRNIFSYRLSDGIDALSSTYKRSGPSAEWVKDSSVKSGTKFSKLKIPYNDELTAGITQKFWRFEAGFKYVHRQARDEITKLHVKNPTAIKVGKTTTTSDDYASYYYIYLNNGKSDSDIFTLTLATTKPITFFNISQYFQFSADYFKSHSNFTDYNKSATKEKNIIYDGKVIDITQLPVKNFAKPWNTRLTTITDVTFSRIKLSWTNFFSLKSSFQDIVSFDKEATDTGVILDKYEIFTFPVAFSWDTKIGVSGKFWGKNTLFVNLDIYNLLDNLNITTATIATSKGGTKTTPTYEAGRSYWIQAGYEF
ncbi:TonB-dependent receptor plug domain-containing protein [Helicobacter sp. 11S02596-1]|uniref:TonB-dependent receptor plug domain-containing protein n=1 Tax=Helicobacter sp. 11S02596-1 TaxID=1476194 RepID=UPI000BA5FD87|nr:TonB-dependent receptor plug domain-containing protein [Helicobacter sp. 11S02596-1]PAF42509.1 hypothetical protein BJI48_06840 [Helicobacter sp. 11S02596-1]